jgi:hypothetical protein
MNMLTGNVNRGRRDLYLVTALAAAVPLTLGFMAWWRSGQFEVDRTFAWPLGIVAAAVLCEFGQSWARPALGLVCALLTLRLLYTAAIAATINPVRSALTLGLALVTGACTFVVFSSVHIRAFVERQRGGAGRG